MNACIKSLRFTYVFCCCFLLYETLLQISFACFVQQFQAAFSLNQSALSSLSASYFMSYACCQIVAANLINRYSLRTVFLISSIGLAFSTYLFSISTYFVVACMARFLMGAFSSSAFILVINATKNAFSKQYLTFFIGLCQLFSASFVVVFQTRIAALSMIYSYADLLGALSFTGLVFFVVLWLSLDKGVNSDSLSNQSFVSELRAVLWTPKVYQICMYSFFLWGPVVGMSGLWGPYFLAQKMHATQEQAIFASSLIFFGLAVSSPIIGALCICESYRQKIVYLCPLLGSIVALIFTYSQELSYPQACTLMLLMGAFSAGYEVSYSFIRQIFSDTTANLVTALNNMAAIFGVACFQLAVAAVLTLLKQDTYLAFLVVVLFYAVALLLAYCMQHRPDICKSTIS